ncbi:MAG: site-specific integrase, partial [Winogradskyella sp.]|nr:site-specific integrase [Winogradskyella sp.]
MANVKTTLDTRRAKSDGTYNVIFRITHSKKIYTINSGISIFQNHWDASKLVVSVNNPNYKRLNLKLLKTYYKIEEALLILDNEFTIDKLRAKLGYTTKADTNLNFKQFSAKVIAQMFEVKRTGNAIVYQTAVNRLISFSNDNIRFEDIDFSLLTNFEHHLKTSGLKQNSISNYLRSIRALYNLAIKHEIVKRSSYPFHNITIKSQRTAKRAISKQDITRLNRLPIEADSPQKTALNYFMLSFYLRGISFTDMAYLKPNNIVNGRVEYFRRKTGKQYSIKLFDLALELIEALSSCENTFLLPVLSSEIVEDSIEAKKRIQQWIKTTNKYLKRLSLELQFKISITTYTSRHSFATIAKRLGYSNELIAEALGHEYGNKTTAIYLDV